MKASYKSIPEYNSAQNGEDQEVCALLQHKIERALPEAESKIWHGSPVWFLDGNPIVGYHKLKEGVRLLLSRKIQWDYKNIVKNKGKLTRLK